nr:MAG TPA: intron associated endonuclease [Bacteriophage sp.]
MSELLQSLEDWTPKPGFGAIYRYDFDNGKSYIGITRYSIEQRYKNHLRADNLVDRALRTHKHSVSLIKVVEEELLADEEIRLIREFGTLWPDGYNYSYGGEGNRMNPESKKKLSESRMGSKNPMWGRHYERDPRVTEVLRESRIIPVRCVETGEVFESLTDAGKFANVTPARICNCCRGLRGTTGGYRWEYVDYPDLASFNYMCHEYQKHINQERYLEECRMKRLSKSKNV